MGLYFIPLDYHLFSTFLTSFEISSFFTSFSSHFHSLIFPSMLTFFCLSFHLFYFLYLQGKTYLFSLYSLFYSFFFTFLSCYHSFFPSFHFLSFLFFHSSQKAVYFLFPPSFPLVYLTSPPPLTLSISLSRNFNLLKILPSQLNSVNIS